MKRSTRWYGLAFVLLLLAAAIVLLAPRDRPTPASQTEAELAIRPRRESAGNLPPNSLPSEGTRTRNHEPAALDLRAIEDFVASRNRSASSLLSAFRISGEKVYLDEALEKFPADPQVLLMALQSVDDLADTLPILETLRLADPENALANYLAAWVHFESGKNDEALRELLESDGKRFNDFTKDSTQNDEEAYLAAGLSPIEAKIKSFPSPLMIMHVASLRQNLDGLRQNYESDGDTVAADAVRRIQDEIGHQIQQSGMIIDLMVGATFEKQSVKGIQTAEAIARLEEIEAHQDSLRALSERHQILMETSAVAESDLLHYFDRTKLFGEKAAMEWLAEKYPKP